MGPDPEEAKPFCERDPTLLSPESGQIEHILEEVLSCPLFQMGKLTFVLENHFFLRLYDLRYVHVFFGDEMHSHIIVHVVHRRNPGQSRELGFKLKGRRDIRSIVHQHGGRSMVCVVIGGRMGQDDLRFDLPQEFDDPEPIFQILEDFRIM